MIKNQTILNCKKAGGFIRDNVMNKAVLPNQTVIINNKAWKVRKVKNNTWELI